LFHSKRPENIENYGKEIKTPLKIALVLTIVSVWYNRSYTMIATSIKPIKTLDLHYPLIQFL